MTQHNNGYQSPEAWPMLANEAQASQIRQLLDGVAHRLTQEPVKDTDPSLAGGAPGISIFLQNYQQSVNADFDSESHNNALWQHIYQYIAEHPLNPSLYCGYAGLAWGVDYLQRNNPQVSQVEDYNEELDEVILGVLDCDSWKGEYETVLGLNGLAFYGLSRLTLGQGSLIAQKAIAHLVKLAQIDEHGAYWPSAVNSRYRNQSVSGEQVNLGLAHGVTGVIAVLLRAVEQAVLLEQTRPLLLDACRWLLAQKNPNSATCYFSINNQLQTGSRLGWCYGDLANAYVLYKAGMVLADETIIDAALEIALNSCNRDINNSGVVDASICHGSAGLMFMYQRLYYYSGDDCFEQAAQYWLQQTLDFATKSKGISGFRYVIGADGSLSEQLGLLEGFSGIGLALMAAITPVEPNWDDIFLLG